MVGYRTLELLGAQIKPQELVSHGQNGIDGKCETEGRAQRKVQTWINRRQGLWC